MEDSEIYTQNTFSGLTASDIGSWIKVQQTEEDSPMRKCSAMRGEFLRRLRQSHENNHPTITSPDQIVCAYDGTPIRSVKYLEVIMNKIYAENWMQEDYWKK